MIEDLICKSRGGRSSTILTTMMNDDDNDDNNDNNDDESSILFGFLIFNFDMKMISYIIVQVRGVKQYI